MAVFTNHSPFPGTTLALFDAHWREVVVVVVSAAFVAPPGLPTTAADEQTPVRESDANVGGPTSSVLFEAEFAPEKPAVDVLVVGRAFAPGGRPAEAVTVSARVGDVRKALRVSGNRTWRPGVLGPAPSAPEPFLTMPVVYERAFGGPAAHPGDPDNPDFERRNPVGVGFRGVPPADPALGTEVPNVEHPGELIVSARQRPAPAGFGVIGKSWQPRVGFGGTYDAAWLDDQFPMLPHDFDPRFYQSAPADQQSRTLRGGEPVEILNMTPEGAWRFTLPTLNLPVGLWYLKRRDAAALRTDTVVIEPDAYRVTLIARLSFVPDRSRGPLQEVVVGHSSPAWVRARATGKIYLDRAGTEGRRVGAEDFFA